jgi:hypothetical protein
MKVEVRYLRNGQKIENVFGVQAPGGVDATAISDCGNAVLNTVSTSWMPWMPTDTTLVEVVVTNLSIEDGTVRVFPAPAGVNGGRGGFALPNETSFAVRLKAAEGGRHGSGRLFWPGLTDADVVNTNFIKSTSAAAIIDAIQELISALAAVSQILVIISRYLNGSPRVSGFTYADVTPGFSDLTLDSQRRRKPGNGS